MPYIYHFFNRRLIILLFLGFSSGLPLALTGAALQAWLTVAGIDIKTIGFLTLVGIPYTFKFIWAPLMDRFEPPLLGRRRGWLIFTQLAIAATCFAMATVNPQASILLLASYAVLLTFLSASQDIVLDAYRTDILAAHERGLGSGYAVFGYRLAMLVSGGLAFILAEQWLGWPNTYRFMACLMICMAVITFLFAPASQAPRLTSASLRELAGFASMLVASILTYWFLDQIFQTDLFLYSPQWLLVFLTAAKIILALAAGLTTARYIGFPSLEAPWKDFFSRDQALWLLLLIILYKLGDAFAGSLTTTFLIRGLGFSQTEVGSVNKIVGLISSIIGVIAGGALMLRWNLYRALMLFGILQALSNFAYWYLAVSTKSLFTMAIAVAIENICGGMGTAAFVAFLMALCHTQFSATQYALLSALASIGRVYVGPASGYLVARFDWPIFFFFTILLALPGLLLLARMRQKIQELDQRNSSTLIHE